MTNSFAAYKCNKNQWNISPGKNDPEDMDPILFLPLVDNKLFPESVRNFFRFGVPEYEPKVETDEKHPKLLKENLFLKNSEKPVERLDEKTHLYEGTELDITA